MAGISVGLRGTYLRTFLALGAAIVVAGAVIAHLVYRSSFDGVKSADRELVRLVVGEMLGELAPPLRHIRSLPSEAEISTGINDPSPENFARMAASLTTLLQRNAAYDQARWIDENGKERVRVDRAKDGGKPIVAPPHALQDKADRDYFRETSALPVGELYVSELNLNIENGVVEMPKKPTLRVATPVADSRGMRRGILIINVLMAPTLSRLEKREGSGIMLINLKGEYLFGPNADGRWETMVDSARTISAEHPASWQAIKKAEDGQVQDDAGLWTWAMVSPADVGIVRTGNAGEPHWVAAIRRTPDFLQRMWLVPWGIAIPFIAVLLLIVFSISRRIAEQAQAKLQALEEKARAEAAAEAQRQRIVVLEEDRKRLGMLAAIVSSSDDAIVSKTLDGIITSWNSGAEKTFGYSAEEAIGKPMLILFPPDRVPEEAEILARIGRGECVKHFITRRRRKDGVEIDVSVTISPIHDAGGRIIGASKVARDVTEFKKAEEELKRHRENLQDLVNQKTQDLKDANIRLEQQTDLLVTITDKLPSMVSYWDARGRCKFANPAYQRWAGLPMAELIEKPIQEVLGDTTYNKLKPKIEAAYRGEVQYYETRLRDPSGKTIYGQVHYIPDVVYGHVVGIFVLVTDVSAIKQAELQLRQANEKLAAALDEAKAANEAKGNFLSNMSHEIRTPMNSVLGFLGLALEGELPPNLRRQLTTAHNAAKSLLMLLNDILDLSKLQSGKIEFERIPLNLQSLINSAVDMFSVKANEKKLNVRIDYAPEAGNRFYGDPMRIRQVITNLLSNAIKFTDAGTVCIAVRPATDFSGVVLTVSDSGIGMTHDQMRRIFAPFVQADTSMTRRFGGTGLGVSICRQIAESMGGTISVESEAGKGSAFHVGFPLEPLPDDVECPDADIVGNEIMHSPRRFKVLLADDIEENIELGIARLMAQGHAVDIARSGRQAMKSALSGDYDIILMDVHMPEMNGLDATRAIRQAQEGAQYQVPIVALTASVLAMERDQCMAAGMTGFVGKPIDFGELFATMEALVPAERGQKNNGSAKPASAALRAGFAAGIDPDVVDWEEGPRRWGDTDLYVTALMRFSARYADTPQKLRALLALADWTGGYELAHAFKGIASNLSLMQAARIGAKLNDLFKAENGEGLAELLDELEAACRKAVLAVARIADDYGAHRQKPADAMEEAEETGGNLAALDDLLRALENDDPGAVELALGKWSAALPKRLVARIQSYLEDYEFDQAKALIDGYRQSIIRETELQKEGAS